MTLILMTFNFAVNWYHSLRKENASLELVLDRKTSISQRDKSTKQFEHIEHNMHIFFYIYQNMIGKLSEVRITITQVIIH